MPADIRSLAALAVLIVSIGCASTRPVNPATLDRLNQIAPVSGDTSALVLYRNTVFGSMFGPLKYKGSVFIDEQPVCDVEDDTYLILDLAPGRHALRIMGRAANVPMMATGTVTAAPGLVQFMELETEQGVGTAQVNLVPRPAPPLSAIARDCRELPRVDLAQPVGRASVP